MIKSDLKGYALAAIAAAAYGTNPIFAVPLYESGMNPDSVLLFRYLLGLPLLAAIMAVRKTGFRLSGKEAVSTAVPGILMGMSSLALFESYNYMNVGIASTLLFVYPLMVALLMSLFFKEKFRLSTGICLLITGCGLALLMKPGDDATLSVYGCVAVFISALTYAVYIILVNVSSTVRSIPTIKLLFYVLLWGCLLFAARMALASGATVPASGEAWLNVAALALIPTVISFACTTKAIQLIGSTPTAILGALEPVSAVVLSMLVLGQSISPREIAGGILIILATTIVAAAPALEKAWPNVRKLFPQRQV
ncbi:MAG: DMT family transporter [Muribaculaceae bacterium]|nr:DMT family transporter [Muribaculaceae bacterium]